MLGIFYFFYTKCCLFLSSSELSCLYLENTMPEAHAELQHVRSWHSPLVVCDVQVSVDGQEGLLQEADPLPLLLLRLLEDGLHLLHVARRVGRHVLQGFLVVLLALRPQHKGGLVLGLRQNTADKVPTRCFFFHGE